MRSRKLLIGLAAVGVLFVGLAAPAAAQSFRDIPELGDGFCDEWEAFNDGDDPFYDEACGPASEDDGPDEEEAPDEDDGEDRAAQCALIDPIIEAFAEGGAPAELVEGLQAIADVLDCPAAEDEPAPADPPPPAEEPPPESAPVLPRTGGALMGLGALGLAGLGGLGLAIRRFLA
jgi:hypothetical protein